MIKTILLVIPLLRVSRTAYLVIAAAFLALSMVPVNTGLAAGVSISTGIQLKEDSGLDDTPPIDDTPRATHNTHAHPAWFSDTFLNLPEDLKDAQSRGKKGLILYFGQTHCAYCDALLKVNFEQEEDIVHYTQQYFDVIALDIWGNRQVTDFEGNQLEEKVLAEFEDTDFTPSMIFYTDEGTEALRLRGYYPPYKFRGALKYVVEEYYKTESFAEYFARATPPPKFDLEDMNEQEFFESPPYALDRSHFDAERPLVVFFERRNCHACDILHSDPLEDRSTRDLMSMFDAVQLDMWSEQKLVTPSGTPISAREWAEDLGIFYTPTLVFFDEKGKEIFRLDSVVRLYRLQGVLEYVLARGYETAPTYQRWREMMQQGELQ